MHRWIVIGIGVATVVLACAYQHWVVAACSAVATLFAFFRKPEVGPPAHRPGRGFADKWRRW